MLRYVGNNLSVINNDFIDSNKINKDLLLIPLGGNKSLFKIDLDNMDPYQVTVPMILNTNLYTHIVMGVTPSHQWPYNTQAVDDEYRVLVQISDLDRDLDNINIIYVPISPVLNNISTSQFGFVLYFYLCNIDSQNPPHIIDLNMIPAKVYFFNYAGDYNGLELYTTSNHFALFHQPYGVEPLEDEDYYDAIFLDHNGQVYDRYNPRLFAVSNGIYDLRGDFDREGPIIKTLFERGITPGVLDFIGFRHRASGSVIQFQIRPSEWIRLECTQVFKLGITSELDYSYKFVVSTDEGQTWNFLSYDVESGLIDNEYYSVYIAGVNNESLEGYRLNIYSPTDATLSDLSISGDIHSLGSCMDLSVLQNATEFFAGTPIVDASGLNIENYYSGSASLNNVMCTGLFSGCSSLVYVPFIYYEESEYAQDIPAYQFARMFENCTSLVDEMVNFPGDNAHLNNYSFSQMFKGCTNLEVIPALYPTSTSGDWCYYQMFEGCTKIKISTTQDSTYINEYRIPYEYDTLNVYSFKQMFIDTGGSYTGTIYPNTIYYTPNTIYSGPI